MGPQAYIPRVLSCHAMSKTRQYSAICQEEQRIDRNAATSGPSGTALLRYFYYCIVALR